MSMTASKLRGKFVEQAEFILDKYIELAKDDSEEHRTESIKAQNRIFDALVPMLQSAGDVQRIRAGSTGDIFNLLKRGKITVAEAERLMSMLHKDFEMTALPELMAQFEELNKK